MLSLADLCWLVINAPEGCLCMFLTFSVPVSTSEYKGMFYIYNRYGGILYKAHKLLLFQGFQI